jgi:hypothetical protein
MIQKPADNKPMHEAQMDFFNWVNANTFGKVRQIKDAFEYSLGWTGLPTSFHAQADAIKNVSATDLSMAISLSNSTTNMLLNYNLLAAKQYDMLACYKEWKLGAENTTNTVANFGNPVTAQTITFSGLSTSTYYVIYLPTNKASTVTIANGAFVNNTTIATNGGLPAGFTGLMFLPSSVAPVITLTAALGVGLTTGTNTQLKLYPVSLWTPNECKIWICSDSV